MATSLKSYATPISALLLSLLLFTLLYTANVKAAPDSSTINKQQQAESLTESLKALNLAYQRAESSAAEQALEKLRNVAMARHDFLLGLIKKDPATVLAVSLSAEDRAKMPEAIRDFIEERVEFEGQLKVLYADYDNAPAELRHYLVSDQGNGRISLHFKKSPKGFKTGQKITVEGIFFEDKERAEGTLGAMALESDEDILTLALGGSGTEGAAGENYSIGEQSVAVILVNFLDNAEEPITVDAAHDLVFNQTNNFMQESSFGQNWLAGQTTGWYNLAINQTCIDIEIANAAKEMATANQIDLSRFSRIVYMFPNNPSCGWSGLGTVGGAQSESWINGRFEVRVVGHELGHNYGLHHAHSLECGNTTTGNNCVSQEYGDKYDIMGVNFAAHYNAFHKEQLGWMSTANADIVEVSTSGQYTISVYQTGSGTRAIKIPKGLDESGNQVWYYLEYRQSVGFDSFLENYPEITSGVIIRSGTAQDIRSSYLYDMTPASSTYFDWDDAALLSGASYQDSDAGISVSVLGINSETATLDITLAGGGSGSSGGSEPTAENQVPVAVDDAIVTAINTTISVPVLNNDYDLDDQTINLVSATNPSNGTVSVNANGTIEYKPRRKFVGADSFSYSITDGIDTATAVVTVDVQNSTSGGGGKGTGNGAGGKGGGKNR